MSSVPAEKFRYSYISITFIMKIRQTDRNASFYHSIHFATPTPTLLTCNKPCMPNVIAVLKKNPSQIILSSHVDIALRL